jgi:hypothetical protein
MMNNGMRYMTRCCDTDALKSLGLGSGRLEYRIAASGPDAKLQERISYGGVNKH